MRNMQKSYVELPDKDKRFFYKWTSGGRIHGTVVGGKDILIANWRKLRRLGTLRFHQAFATVVMVDKADQVYFIPVSRLDQSQRNIWESLQ